MHGVNEKKRKKKPLIINKLNKSSTLHSILSDALIHIFELKIHFHPPESPPKQNNKEWKSGIQTIHNDTQIKYNQTNIACNKENIFHKISLFAIRNPKSDTETIAGKIKINTYAGKMHERHERHERHKMNERHKAITIVEGLSSIWHRHRHRPMSRR